MRFKLFALAFLSCSIVHAQSAPSTGVKTDNATVPSDKNMDMTMGSGTAEHGGVASEFFHQPHAHAFEVVPHAGYRTLNETPSGSVGGPTQNLAGLDMLGATVAYGLCHQMTLGFDISYSKFNTDPAGYASKGFEPLDLFVQMHSHAGEYTLHYGLDLSFGLERARIGQSDYANRSWGDPVDGLNSGGFKVTPFIGVDRSIANSSFGAKLSADVVSASQNVDFVLDGAGTQTYSLSGGARGHAAVFYEYRATDVPLGIAITYDWIQHITNDNSGLQISGTSGLSLIGTKLYANIPLGGFDFLPSIVWRERASSDDFQKTSDIHLNVAGRFAF